jgi:hypothetical protein
MGHADVPDNHCVPGRLGTTTVEWAVLDGDVLETWPSRDAAVAELNSFYSDNARLVCRTVTDWVDAGGRS